MAKGASAGSMRSVAVELKDVDGNSVSVLTETAVETILDAYEARTSAEREDLQGDILTELRIMNFHLSLITENKITCLDVED